MTDPVQFLDLRTPAVVFVASIVINMAATASLVEWLGKESQDIIR